MGRLDTMASPRITSDLEKLSDTMTNSFLYNEDNTVGLLMAFRV